MGTAIEKKEQELIEAARDQLQRVLDFFPRVATGLSVVMGVDLGMLALLATNAPPVQKLDWSALLALPVVFFIGCSLWQIYKATFPQLSGGIQSLLYFKEIALLDEGKYLEQFRKQTVDDYVNDLLRQAWRNSEILTEKYKRLQTAFVMLAPAVVTWIIAIVTFAEMNTTAKSFLEVK